MNMAKKLLKIEEEKTQILMRIELLERKSEEPVNKGGKATTFKRDQEGEKNTKNIILAGLNEIPNEDVYDTTFRAGREIGINIFDNDINIGKGTRKNYGE